MAEFLPIRGEPTRLLKRSTLMTRHHLMTGTFDPKYPTHNEPADIDDIRRVYSTANQNKTANYW
jgi:hypothetical protein